MEESEIDKSHKEAMTALWDKFRALSPESFAYFLSERGVHITCPMCNNDDMIFPQASEQKHDANGTPTGEWFTYVNPSKVNSFGFEPLHSLLRYNYRLICENCGHETLFSAHPVLTWLGSRDKRSEGE